MVGSGGALLDAADLADAGVVEERLGEREIGLVLTEEGAGLAAGALAITAAGRLGLGAGGGGLEVFAHETEPGGEVRRGGVRGHVIGKSSLRASVGAQAARGDDALRGGRLSQGCLAPPWRGGDVWKVCNGPGRDEPRGVG